MKETREKAAEFIERHANDVKDIIESGRGKFDFSEYVSEWNLEHTCGTVCCMEGHLPTTRPDLAVWDVTNRLVRDVNGETFYPSHVNIPISDRLWNSLTLSGCQDVLRETDLAGNSPFEVVYDLWINVAAEIRKGNLDNFIIASKTD